MKILEGRIHHIHCHVRDVDKAKALFTKILGDRFGSTFTLTDWKAKGSMSSLGIELGQALGPDSVSANEIKEGIAAVSFLVEDLDQAVAEMESYGLKVLRRYQVPGVIRDALFDSRDTFGITIELTELGPKYDKEASLARGDRGEKHVLKADFSQKWEKKK